LKLTPQDAVNIKIILPNLTPFPIMITAVIAAIAYCGVALTDWISQVFH